jgi:predicted transporter
MQRRKEVKTMLPAYALGLFLLLFLLWGNWTHRKWSESKDKKD